MDECEWNPEKSRAKYYGEPCPNEATTIVGADGRWRLCDFCAALPAFKRFRSRIPIRRPAAPTEDWLRRAAEAEDAAGSVSVGGLAADLGLNQAEKKDE